MKSSNISCIIGRSCISKGRMGRRTQFQESRKVREAGKKRPWSHHMGKGPEVTRIPLLERQIMTGTTQHSLSSSSSQTYTEKNLVVSSHLFCYLEQHTYGESQKGKIQVEGFQRLSVDDLSTCLPEKLSILIIKILFCKSMTFDGSRPPAS